MSLRRRLYSGNPGLDFRSAWTRSLVISLVLVVLCGGSLLVRGLNLGIDFVGGGVWEVPSEDLSIEATRDALRPSGNDDARIQVVTSGTGIRSIRIQAGNEAVDDADTILAALAEVAGIPASEVSSSVIGPSWGDEITREAQRALVFFFIAIALYITIRLDWKMAIAALVAVTHDIIISVGIYSLFQFTVTPATVIAFLTILGYSLYDTVVVFDKVRESAYMVSTTNKLTYTDMANYATNEVFMRSVNTSITSVLPIAAILVVGSGIMGATTLQEFGIALLVGMLVGAYSSIFVAVPALVWLKERQPDNAEIRTKLGGHRQAVVTSTDVLAMAPAPKRPRAEERDAARVTSPAAKLESRVMPTVSHPPRPRKKGKRR
ncbi:MAG: protein translocase subunit SecF [Acidimicrobiales bacterium]